MGFSIFLRLKSFFGIWEEVNEKDVPKWVLNASYKFQIYFGKKYSHNPYGVTKQFVGDNFVYRVFYKSVAQGQYEPIYYRKMKYFGERRNTSESFKIGVAKGVNAKNAESKAPNYDALVKRFGRTWSHSDLYPSVNGRTVRCWLLIHSADDQLSDEYIPIFYKKTKKSK